MGKADDTRYKVALATELLGHDERTRWEEWFTARRIAEKAGVGLNRTYVLLQELVELGSVEKLERDGEARYRWRRK